jgi:hypothetical protein
MVSIAELAAVLSAAGILIGTVFVLFQLRHMEMHRNVEISMKLFEWAESERLRKAFRWVENKLQLGDYEKYKTQEEVSVYVRDYPYEVTAFFELVGFLVEKRFVDLDVIDDRIGPHIISNWKKLELWILALRKEKNDATFGEHFQNLYEKTIRYMRKR